MDRNNTNFPLYTYNFLKSLKPPKDEVLLYHQYIVKEYLNKMMNLRGILVFHGMGTGKTKLSGGVIREMTDTDRRIIIMSPKSIQFQFSEQLREIGVNASVKYVSIKSSNMMSKVKGIDIDIDIPISEEMKLLENSLLIIDEVHNIFNAICNGSKNAIELYDMVMNTKNIKLIFLTGSPVINEPFELVPCFNMLAGVKLFPENRETFNKYFIDENSKMINTEKFKNRIVGLVSYYGDWVRDEKSSDVPDELPVEIIHVPMSDKQYSIYASYREKEMRERNYQGKASEYARFRSSKANSSYRIKSRMASNMVPIRTITDKELMEKENCPKFHKCIEIVERYNSSKGIIYSEFVNNGGIIDIGRLLSLKGWKIWTENCIIDDKKNTKRFALIHGGVDEADRVEIIKYFNKPENKFGDYLRLILMGPSGAEGLEFKDSRFVIVASPFFNYTRIEQVKHRIKRHKSHENLPKKDRNVKLYILLADYPKKVDKKREPTTDIYLLYKSRKEKLLHMQFYKAMVEASVDCGVHRDKLPKSRKMQIHCKVCNPTDSPLFSNKLDADIQNKNPCEETKMEEIKVKEIIVEDDAGGEHKYAYHLQNGEYHFYEYNENLNGYFPIARNDPYFDLLLQTAQKKSK